MLSRAQNIFHHNPRLRGPVSSEIKRWFITLLQKGIPDPVFYGDLDYKLKKSCWKA